LRRGRNGSTSYVFADDPPVEGAVGGAPVPVAALRGDRIRTDAKAAVGAYLLTFGLNHEQARRVIMAVGVARDFTTFLGGGAGRAPACTARQGPWLPGPSGEDDSGRGTTIPMLSPCFPGSDPYN
jgi:hypothetical protein